MLYIGADNPYDTQEDLLANVVGACTALALRWFRGVVQEHHFEPTI